jgi:hypothetical protein
MAMKIPMNMAVSMTMIFHNFNSYILCGSL